MTVYPDDHHRSEVLGSMIIRSDPAPSKGLGRWIYCKYCYKKVLPLLGGCNQVVCSKCGYGLTPDFFAHENLLAYLSGDYEDLLELIDKDHESEEAELWLNATRRENENTAE